MAAFYGGLCFFGGCVWMATGKKNKNAEAQGYLYADEMHVERSQFEDNKPAWKKAK
jgi:hypothetical protein